MVPHFGPVSSVFKKARKVASFTKSYQPNMTASSPKITGVDFTYCFTPNHIRFLKTFFLEVLTGIRCKASKYLLYI